MTECNSCGSQWVTGDSIHWERETCMFCGSSDLERADTLAKEDENV